MPKLPVLTPDEVIIETDEDDPEGVEDEDEENNV